MRKATTQDYRLRYWPPRVSRGAIAWNLAFLAAIALFRPGLFPLCALSIVVQALCRRHRPCLEIRADSIVQRWDSLNRSVLALDEVERVEWPGGDNVGLRLRSGKVTSIWLGRLPRWQWDAARSDVLPAVETHRRRRHEPEANAAP
jgi:hypothetical protein